MSIRDPFSAPLRRLIAHPSFGGLRFRFAMLLTGGVLIVSLGLYLLLVTITSEWLYQELEARNRGYAGMLASRASLPLLIDERSELREELQRALRETDVLGVAVYRDTATLVAEASYAAGLWTQSPHSADAVPSGASGSRRPRGGTTLEALVPVVREAAPDSSGYAEALELLEGGGAARRSIPRVERIGWARVVVSTARIDTAIARVSSMGLLLLVALLLLAAIPLGVLMRVMVQPLREASGLAREIAAGRLDQRLPVRSRDELGMLAESLNRMAESLAEARADAHSEAEALRAATEAMLAIAHGARHNADPNSLFGMLATELRRITGCEGVALAVAREPGTAPRFERFDPPAPWGELVPEVALDVAIASSLSGAHDAPLRRELNEDSGTIERTLLALGYRTLLVVPLGTEDGPAAALVLVARRREAFPPSELDVIAALASHLSSALHASQLRDAMGRAFDELDAARGQLVRAERLRVAGEMASGVAHDFNNVLGAILGRAQLLRRRAERQELMPDELLRSLEVIERAAHDGGDTVARLRQFGQSREAIAPEVVDLDRVLRDAAEFTRTRWENEAQAGGRRITVTLESEPGVWVAGHSNELREVFTNLILNAIDALPSGGTIRMRSATEAGRCTAWVEDNGSGMNDDVRRRVFDPFFTTKGEGGTGLGLSVVYGIVERHGGEIAIYSEIAIGTRVELAFPRVAAPVAPLPAPQAPGPATAVLDVLVVDDEAPVRELLKDVIEALGHRARVCDSGERALQEFRAGAFDLVLTDLGMPGITGWQLARRVREQDPAVTIAFITGWGHELSPDVVRDSGADAIVGKPFRIEDIEELTRLALRGRPDRNAA